MLLLQHVTNMKKILVSYFTFFFFKSSVYFTLKAHFTSDESLSKWQLARMPCDHHIGQEALAQLFGLSEPELQMLLPINEAKAFFSQSLTPEC